MAKRLWHNTTWARWRRVRQLVQILLFVFFVYLLFAALQRRVAFPLADLFFRLDPLDALGAMLASREWIPKLGLALLTVGLTLLVSRVWCGWMCPLGSLLEWFSFPRRRSAGTPSVRWRGVKYFILTLIVTAAVFGSLTLIVLDPLALLTRTMTTVILPGLNYTINALMTALYPVQPLRGILDAIERLVRGSVLPVKQPIFAGNALIAALFVVVIGLNGLADRFWCRYLCPLGALLALLSRMSLLRPFIGGACTGCGQCAHVCHLDAIDAEDGHRIVPGECTVCLDCLAACSERGIGFRPSVGKLPASAWLRANLLRRSPAAEPVPSQEQPQWPAPAQPYDPGRRQLLAAVVTGVAGVVVLRTGLRAHHPHQQLIRPPGVEDEADFLARCLRCSQCMKVCPTSGLQPVMFETGLEALWTPRLVSRVGYCNYGCNACGQVCPSHAIPALDLDRKRQAVLGVAVIDHNRCLPWAEGVPCIVCEEMCPVPNKAIGLEEVMVTDPVGQSAIVQRPHVLSDLCIGCGICEYQCPVAGEAAIQVYRQ